MQNTHWLLQFPVTYALLALNFVVSGYCLYSDRAMFERLAFHVGAILRLRQWDRIVTSGFVHGSVLHFLFNMLTLYSFGRLMELRLGPWGYLALYLGSLLASSLLMLYIKRHDLNYAAVGASGAVCGVLFGYCLFRPFGALQIMFIPIDIPAIIFALVFIGFSVHAARSGMMPGIAHEGHLGGAVAGILLTILIEPRAWDIFLQQISRFGG